MLYCDLVDTGKTFNNKKIYKCQKCDLEAGLEDPNAKEQINSRMDICNSCEYYKDDACMLCGCRVVRDTVYQNKLADKSASCPDGRWKAIED